MVVLVGRAKKRWERAVKLWGDWGFAARSRTLRARRQNRHTQSINREKTAFFKKKNKIDPTPTPASSPRFTTLEITIFNPAMSRDLTSKDGLSFNLTEAGQEHPAKVLGMQDTILSLILS